MKDYERLTCFSKKKSKQEGEICGEGHFFFQLGGSTPDCPLDTRYGFPAKITPMLLC